MTPLADGMLPTPTNKECSLQPGKITGRIRGDCGMPVALSAVVLGSTESLLCLCLSPASFPPSFSSGPLGVEAMCKQQHSHPEGRLVLCAVGTPCLCLIRHISPLKV